MDNTCSEEDFKISKALSPDGLAVLNVDDEIMMSLAGKIKGRIMTYGFSETAMVRASNEKIIYEEWSGGQKMPMGVTFKVDYDGGSYPVRLQKLLGRHQIYPVLAALAFGLAQGLNMVNMIELLRLHEGPPGRLRLIAGQKRSLILDDTYNSSPVALTAALETLDQVEAAGRKIAVIGDMLELGTYTIEAHKEAGRQAAAVCDLVITVGLRAKFVAEGAKEKKFNARNIYQYHDYKTAGAGLARLLKEGDLVLIKGSQSVRLEKVVAEVMLEPEKKAVLLCRQDHEWLGR